jgi:hypothetical protein
MSKKSKKNKIKCIPKTDLKKKIVLPIEDKKKEKPDGFKKQILARIDKLNQENEQLNNQLNASNQKSNMLKNSIIARQGAIIEFTKLLEGK